jgi:hypothetical protein
MNDVSHGRKRQQQGQGKNDRFATVKHDALQQKENELLNQALRLSRDAVKNSLSAVLLQLTV